MQSTYMQALQLLTNGQLDLAESAYKKMIAINKNNSLILNDLGVVYFMRKDYLNANKYYEAALLFDQCLAKTHLNFGNSWLELGEIENAEQSYNLAYNYDTDVDWRLRVLEVLIGLMLSNNRSSDALKYWQQVVAIAPYNLPSLHNYANFLQEVMADYTSACEVFEKIAATDRYQAIAQLYNDWAIACKKLGRSDLAMPLYKKAIEIKPQAHIYSNMVYDLLFDNDKDDRIILETHQRGVELFQSTVTTRYSHAPVRGEEKRRLRIGYISPDFRYHSVGMFCLNVLRNHNHDDCEIFLYYTCPIKEEETEKFKQCTDHWCDVANLNHNEVAGRIYDDKIDILVDLAGHTKGNSIPVFLAKPAKIQMSWIGYTFSTGVSDIDYFITDSIAAPVGMMEDKFCEKLLRMPQCFLCYTPHEHLPPVAETPAKESGHITFGLYGNFAKLNKFMVTIYADILKAVPDSKILIKSISMNDITAKKHFVSLFAECGISAERLLMHKTDEAAEPYLISFNSIDILLDWYPFNGETITCNALSMGVPVVSLHGKSHRSRAGLSILTALGMEQWSTDNAEKFMQIVAELSHDVISLNKIRKGLRVKFLQSTLCDAKAFTNNLEKAYRDAWNDWQSQGVLE